LKLLTLLKKPPIFCIVVLLALTFWSFWPITGADFLNFDDPDYVTNNPQVQGPLNLTAITWAFSTTKTGNWIPLTWLSHMLVAQVADSKPYAHHFANLILHSLNTILLLFLLQRATRQFWPSFLASLLFSVHPIHLESVAWISERKDVLSTFFLFLSIVFYVIYAERRSKSLATRSITVVHPVNQSTSVLPYLASLFTFVLSLMSKSMPVSLPFILLLLDFWPLHRFSPEKRLDKKITWSPLLFEKLPFLVISLIFSVITVYSQRSAGATQLSEELPFYDRLSNALISYCRYFSKLFWPEHMAVFYPHPLHWPLWQVAASLLLLLLISTLAWQKRTAYPFMFVGWFWFLGTLIPVIGLLQVGYQAMADRYTYLPSIGFFFICSWFSVALAARRPALKTVTIFLVSFCVLALSLSTRAQSRNWLSSETLFRHALTVTTNNAVAHQYLGEALLQQGRYPEAEEQFLAALSIRPGYPDAKANYALTLAQEGKLDEAAQRLSSLLKESPDDANLHFNLAVVFQQKGDVPSAVAHYHEAIRLTSDYADALNNLAWILATNPKPELRNGEQAVQLATQACKLTHFKKPIYLGTLAAAQAERGLFSDAIETARKAVSVAEQTGQTELASKNQELLQLYSRHQPFRDSNQ
jgi:tetratricopeptide (TPR) repeat protein